MGQRLTSRVLLVRHCEAPFQGLEAQLTEGGAAAAERLSAQLASCCPDAVYSSPFARAIATVRPFSEQSGHTLAVDERIRERQLSGEPLPDWLDHLKKSDHDVHYRAPGGESLRDVQQQALEVLSEITSRHVFAVVASHGQWIAAVLRSSALCASIPTVV